MKLAAYKHNPSITVVCPEITPEYVATVPFKLAPVVWLQNYLGVKPEVDRWNAHVYFRTNSSLLRIAERERSTALILSVDPSQSRMSKNDIDKAIKIAWSIGEQIITYLANNDAAFTSLVKNSS